ncbi:MAG: DUF885 family protein [Verrucomicrobia bacterium]|nr:DUF885 family protein [Verrucomicrobiota bacterium]
MGLSLEFIYTPPMLEDHSKRWIVMMQLAIGSCITVLLQNLVAVPLPPHDPSVTHLRSMIDRYALDLGNLERFYKIPFSETTFSRLDEFHHSYESMLESLDFDQLDQNSKVDYHLLRTHLKFERRQIVHDRQLAKEAIQVAPWIQTLIPLIEARQRVDAIDPPAIADALHALNGSIQQTLENWRKMDKKTIPPIVANRTSRYVDQLGRHLEEWNGFYNGYHPAFSWWVAKTSEKVRESMKSSAQWLRTEIAGYREGDDAPLLGDPIGRDALLDALRREWIPYSPEELIAIARMEMEWCLKDRKKASRKMGYGEDWQAAQNHVKSLHVDAGEQPQLIKRLAREAEEFLDERDLITIPAIARETWRMEMMSPERQKVNPYFTGGEVISVSFPTAEMEHDHKLMSLRGNNVHFSKATVHHELIPGHHLQLFMAERYNTHRKIFRTPFLIEGWALYWEMLLWDLEFADSPEDRIGMLFWRSHRCARIIFSLSFHLGLMSPQECIDYLVQEVGHEVRNATAEVRRSIQGGYSPLYQAAYMLGGLQLRQLRHEMIHSHQWTDKQFHDAVLIENSIPIELIRASLTGMPVDRDWTSQWRFYPGLPAAPETNPSKPKVNPAEKSPAKAYKATVDPHWFGNDSRFWYRNEVADGQFEFILVDAVEGRRVPAFDHAQVARQLTALTGETCSEYQLPFESIEFHPENPSIRLLGRQKSWLFDPQNGQVSELKVRASSGLTKYNEPIASRDGSTQTEIEFINKLNQRVSIHWIDSDLEERHYQDIEAGKSVFQNTYSGHAWAVRGESGDFIGTYIAGSKNGQAVIDDSPGEKRQPRRRNRRNATPEEMAAMGSISPDGQWKAFVQDHNLHVQNLKKQPGAPTDQRRNHSEFLPTKWPA